MEHNNQELRPVFVSLTTTIHGAVWNVFAMDGDFITSYKRRQNSVGVGFTLDNLQSELIANNMKMVNNPKKKKGNNYE